MSEREQFICIEKRLCLFNRLSIIIRKVLLDEELNESEEKIAKQVLKMEGLEKEWDGLYCLFYY